MNIIRKRDERERPLAEEDQKKVEREELGLRQKESWNVGIAWGFDMGTKREEKARERLPPTTHHPMPL